MKVNVEKLFAYQDDKIIDVINVIQKSGIRHALIVDKKHRLLGLVTDFDIRMLSFCFSLMRRSWVTDLIKTVNGYRFFEFVGSSISMT